MCFDASAQGGRGNINDKSNSMIEDSGLNVEQQSW